MKCLLSISCPQFLFLFHSSFCGKKKKKILSFSLHISWRWCIHGFTLFLCNWSKLYLSVFAFIIYSPYRRKCGSCLLCCPIILPSTLPKKKGVVNGSINECWKEKLPPKPFFPTKFSKWTHDSYRYAYYHFLIDLIFFFI
uniref:Uncharacterized protein n=1 Tax=Rhizophora mucronata TaxID=61149 RepID=A0A2P2LAT6_RHIMU